MLASEASYSGLAHTHTHTYWHAVDIPTIECVCSVCIRFTVLSASRSLRHRVQKARQFYLVVYNVRLDTEPNHNVPINNQPLASPRLLHIA